MEQGGNGIAKEDAVLAFAGGLLNDQESGRRKVRACASAVPNVSVRRFIDVPPCGLLVPMGHSAAAAALPAVAQQLAMLGRGAPLLALFRLPLEQDRLRDFLGGKPSAPPRGPDPDLQPVPHAGSAFADRLRGLDIDAHGRESPVWKFDGARGEVIGSDVWVSLRTVSERLRMPDLALPANEAAATAAVAQALMRSFVSSRNTRAGQTFVEVPAALLASPATWHLFSSLPGATLGRLTVVLRASCDIDMDSLVWQMGEIGVAVCITGVDWPGSARLRLPDGVAWVRGNVTSGMDITRLKEALSCQPARAIADIGTDVAALESRARGARGQL